MNPRNVTPTLHSPESEPIPLDELFGAAVASRSTREELHEAQRRARTVPPDSDLGREASAVARRLLMQLEWAEVALVALLNEQVCACGRTHFWLEGEYIERAHVRDKTARWQILRSGQETVVLPKRVEYRTQRVKICPSCMKDHGYV